MSHVAISKAIPRPISPLTIHVQRATRSSVASLIEGRNRWMKSTLKAVETLLMLLEIVLIVAAKIAAMSSPASPAGI